MAEKLSDGSAFCHAGKVIASAIGQGLDGAGRLVPPAGHETAPVHDEKVGDIVGTMVFVHD
jgi:hypothetical protein